MCGIAGYVSTGGAPADAAAAWQMIATLRHRGPDDAGVAVSGPAALAAARLSIIDVAGGHQPIASDGGRVTVVQNGEIYNYIELRNELVRRGRTFATASDTEVIAALYAEFGDAAFERMRGMFAIAIWDQPRSRLVLARDRVGKKPLYFMQSGDRFLFASETKAILSQLPTVPGVSAAALTDFLTFGYVAGNESIFRGMSRVPPGSTLVLEDRQPPRTTQYWRWPQPAAVPVPDDEYLDLLAAELDEAVRIRLRSDVPLGAFLSGGLDSAVVLALMAKHSTRPVKTFSIGFGDPEYDELAEARETAAAFGADHHEWQVSPDCVAIADQLAVHYDEPFADASAIPTYFVAQLAKRHVTVCLTGDGGDELFAGYTPYAQALARSTGAVSRGVRGLVGIGARWLPAHARGKGRLSTLALGPEAWFVWRRTVFPDYLLQRIVPRDLRPDPTPEREAVSALLSGSGPLLERLQSWDQRHYLPGDILVKVDRATMAHSLEARCPLLDHRIVEIAAQQPSWRHGSAASTKQMFRRVAARWLPAATLDRPKRGFGVPLRRWFGAGGGMIGWAREILQDRRTGERGWTDAHETQRLLQQHESGARDHAKRIWALVCLELWARRHVDRAGSREQACA